MLAIKDINCLIKGVNMNTHEIKAKLAGLESKCDVLETELDYLNRLLMRCGFSDGLHSFKSTVEALLSEDVDDDLE